MAGETIGRVIAPHKEDEGAVGELFFRRVPLVS